MNNTLDRQLAELDQFPEEIVVTGDEGYEYGRTREEETGLLGAFRNLYTPVRRKVIEPEVTTYTQAVDAMPGEYTKTYKPAVYGEEEVGFEYMPIVRGSKAAFDYAVDLFDSGEVMDKAIDSIAAIPSAMSDAIADQVTSAMGMGMGYESMIDRDGTEIRYDPLMAPAVAAPAGIAARVVAKESGDTVLGIFGGKLGTRYGDRVNAENDAVSDIVDALEKRDGREYDISNSAQLIKKAEDGEIGIADESGNVPVMITGEPAARYFREMIFRKSGVFIGEDGQKRYEIRTRDAGLGGKLERALQKDLTGDQDEDVLVLEQVDNLFTYGDAYLDDVISLPELFDEYPQLRDFRVEYLDAEDIADGVGGHMDIGSKTIRINPSRVPTGNEREDYKNFMSLMLHEIQHAVDSFEGRQNGANIQMFLPNNFKAQKMNNDISISFQGNQIINHMDASRKLPSPEELFSPEGLRGDVDDIYSTIDSIYVDLKTMQGLKDGTIDPNSRAGELINDPNHLEEILEDDYLVELLRRTKPYIEKYDQLSLDKFNASKKYLATSGEVDAREVESRYKNPERQRYDFGMLHKKITPENILGQEVEDFRIPGQYGVFPEKDVVQKDINLTDYEGNPVSTQTDEAFSLMEPLKEKSTLRKLYDQLPEEERNALPKQPDENRLFGYHGTASARTRDEPFFDINFARKNDQFLGEGFYFTLDPEVASEYASIRGIKSERQIKGEQAKKILADENVIPSERGKKGSGTSVEVTPQGEYVTGGSMMKGQDIYGNPVSVGQYIGRFDLSNLEKPYVVRTEKQRKELKKMIPQLKEEGYDSILFADFKDRSKQIMVFPEHMNKVDTSRMAGRSASTEIAMEPFKEADALEIGINPAMKDGALLRKYDASTVNSMVENASAANAGTKAANKLIGAEVPDGTQVGIRLNLNSTIPNMPRGLDKLQTLHEKNYNGKALSYRPFATVENVIFNVNQKGRQGIAAKIKGVDVPEAKNKFPAMSVDGQLNNSRNILDEMDDDVVEIGFNPMSGHLFVDMSTGQAVQSAEIATVVGDRVYAKGVTYMKKAEAPDPLPASDGTPLPSEVRYKMKKGGLMSRS